MMPPLSIQAPEVSSLRHPMCSGKERVARLAACQHRGLIGRCRSEPQVGMRVRQNQMGMRDRMHLVLDSRSVPDNLVAACRQPPEALGIGVGQPPFKYWGRSSAEELLLDT